MLKPFLQLIRAPNGLTAVSNIIAAAVIASSGQINLSVILLLIASIAFYYGGMALNDCFDYKEDAIERAKRPLPSGQIKLSTAWALGFSLILLGLSLSAYFAWPDLTSLLVGVALSTCIILYNSIVKDGFIGSIFMGLCRYFNWLLGASFIIVSQSDAIAMANPPLFTELTQDIYLIALPIFFYITGLTFLSKQETHASNRNALGLTSVLLILTSSSLFYLVWCVLAIEFNIQLIGSGLISLWTIVMLKRLIPLWCHFTPDNIQSMIMFMIIGVIPLDALMLAISGHYIWAMIVLALLPPCRILSKYLYMT